MSTAKERKALAERLANLSLPEKRRVRGMIAEAAHLAAPLFTAAHWKWTGDTGTDEEMHVPTEAEIALAIASLARTVLEDGAASCFSGRFGVSLDTDPENADIGLTIELQLGSAYIERFPDD